MAHANVSNVRGAGFGLKDAIAALVRSFNEGAARRRIYKRTVAELSALTDRDLTDLGIHRMQIRRVALDAANGK